MLSIFFTLFVVLSIYRIIIRHSLIAYCAKGKHKRYAVFIGGGNNMQMLYEEMESSLASIYEVVGYFDIKHNETFFISNVYIWVILKVLLILCLDKQE